MAILTPQLAGFLLDLRGSLRSARAFVRRSARAGLSIAPALTEIALVVALGIVVARGGWDLFLPVPLPDADAVTAHAGNAAGAATPRSGFDITSIDPFSRVPGNSRQSTAAAPETTLNLKLYGVRAKTAAGEGSAIIRLPDGKQRVFLVGEQIINGVRLRAVAGDHVTIERAGVSEALYLGDGPRTAVAAPASGVAPNTSSQSPAATADGTTAFVSSLLDQVELKPRRQGNRINGFYLMDRDGSGRVAALGLQPGDVILSVNGVDLVAFERVTELAGELRGARRLTLDIERDGTRQRIERDLGNLP